MHSEQPYQPPTPLRTPSRATAHRRAVSPDMPVNIPSGMFVILGASVAGLVASFFNTSQDSMMFSVLLGAATLCALALLMRLEVVRKIMLGLACLAVVLSVISTVKLVGYQHRMNQSTAAYQKAMGQANPDHLTTAQKAQMRDYQRQMIDLRQKAGRALSYSYVLLGAYALGGMATIVYVSQPAVRAACARPVQKTTSTL